MRKILPVLLILLIFSMPKCLSVSAYAQTTGYGRVLKEGVCLYRNPGLEQPDIMFTLTVSYYVFILDINTAANCYEVEYQDNSNGYVKIIGYVNKQDVSLAESPAAPYYPVIAGRLIKNSFVYQTAGANSQILVSAMLNQNVKCYGSLYNEAEEKFYYYVKLGSEFGYIAGEAIDVTLPSQHPDPMPTAAPTAPPQNEATVKPITTGKQNFDLTKGDNTLQILLIAAICIPALIIVYLMFKPSKRSRRNYKRFYGEDGEE